VGYWMNAQQLVTQAAYQGARQGSLTNDNGQIQGAIAANLRAIDPNINNGSLARTSVTISPSSPHDGGRRRGGALTVTIRYKMPFIFGSLPEKFQYVNATMVTRMQCDPVGGVICPP
jgi:Flp pilus assembly protein TadG